MIILILNSKLALNFQMELFILDSLIRKTYIEKDLEYKYGLMDLNILASGSMEKLMVLEDLYWQKVIFMKVNGKMIKLMDMENIITQMVVVMKDNG